MTAQRATDHDSTAIARSAVSRRVRSFAVGAGLLSLVVCGAVAQASDGGGADGVPSGAKVAAAAASSTTAPPDGTVDGGQPAPADGLGDDPALDALAEACFADDLIACDRLYLQSPIDSGYEGYGDTCGGRQDAGTGRYCGLGTAQVGTEPVPPDDLGDDPALDALAESCYAGDMAACDELYGSAEAGSPYQVYGDTCAGRQPENTGRYCTALENPIPGGDAVPTSEAGGEPSVPEGTQPPASLPTDTTDTTVEPVEPGDVPAPTLEPTDLGDDPTLDGFAQSCYDGDLGACDDLYQASEADTPYRQYGDTCAGRQPEDTGVWCVDAFAPTTPTSDTAVPPSPPGTVDTAVPSPPPTVDTLEPATSVAPTSPPTTVAPATTVAAETVPPTSIDLGPPDDSTPLGPVPLPPPTIEPTGLGDDPTLDQLAQSCYDGEMVACDDLWREAEIDSAYRDYADTCAGRQPADTGNWCVDAFAATPASTEPGSTVPATTAPPGTVPTTSPTGLPLATDDPTGLGDDPALDALAQSCFDGDMEACDDLFDRAPIGSDYMAYGDTCAGRQEAGTFTYCQVAFPGASPAGARR